MSLFLPKCLRVVFVFFWTFWMLTQHKKSKNYLVSFVNILTPRTPPHTQDTTLHPPCPTRRASSSSRRLSRLLTNSVSISNPPLIKPGIVVTRGYRAKPYGLRVEDKLSSLMKIQQAHRDAPSPSSSGRNMKRRRKKDVPTPLMQK